MASQSGLSFNLGLPAAPEVESQEVYNAVLPVYNALRNAAYALDAYTGSTPNNPADLASLNAVTNLLIQKSAILFVKLTETVSAGHMVNLWNSSGLRGRKAVGGTTQAHCYAVLGGVSGDTIPVCFFGLCSSISGLTPGTHYYLSSSAGQVTPSATYHYVGVAISSSQLWFTPRNS